MRRRSHFLCWAVMAVAFAMASATYGNPNANAKMPPPLPGNRVDHTIDAVLDRAMPALSGSRLLLQFEGEAQLRVLSLATGAFEDPIRLI